MARIGDTTRGRLAGAGLSRLERTLVVLIALHSVVVGLVLSFATEWGARRGGFPSPVPPFFPRQAGAFHFVVAGVYLVEYFRYRGVVLLIMTKAIAVAFLGVSTMLSAVPWVVPLSGLADAGMGLGVLWLRRSRGLPLAGAAADP